MQLPPYIIVSVLSLLVLGLLYLPQARAAESKRDIVMVVDNSGSMKKNDPQFLAHHALKTFVSTSGGDTRLALISFDKSVNVSVPLTALDDTSRSVLLEAINEIDYSGPLTNSPQALERAIDEFSLYGQDDTEKSIVFITDGIVDTGNREQDKLQEARMQNELSTLASKLNIRIFGIAFAQAANYPLIEELVSKTKGEYFKVLNAEQLPIVFARIATLSRPAATPVLQEPSPPESVLDSQAAIETVVEAQQPNPTPTPDPTRTIEYKPLGESIDAEPALIGAESPAQSRPLSIQSILLNKARRLYSGNELVIYCVALVALIAFSALLLSRKGAQNKTASRTMRYSSPGGDQLEALLIDIDNRTSTRNHPLTKRMTRIGRAKTGTYDDDIHHLWIDKPTIGREHAFIEYKDGGYWVIDNDSTNGTFINGKRVTGRARLKDDSRISFHNVQFIFRVPDLSEFEKTVSAPIVNQREDSVAEQTVLLGGKQDIRQPLRTSSAAATRAIRSQTDIGAHTHSQGNSRYKPTENDGQNLKPFSNTVLQNRKASNDNKALGIGPSSIRQVKKASKTVTEVYHSPLIVEHTEKLKAVNFASDTKTEVLEQIPQLSDTAEIQVVPSVESKRKTAVGADSNRQDTIKLDIV